MAQDADKSRARGATEPLRNRYDWHALRAEWVAGSDTLADFARVKGLPVVSVRRRAAAEGWTAQREASKAKVAAGVVEGAVRHRIRTESQIDGQAHRAASRFARHVGRMLAGVERLTLDDAAKVKAAVEALEKAHRLARVTAHLPAEPRPDGGDATRVEVVIRGVDEHGELYEVAGDGARPVGLPADGDAGEVPPE
jgi:hypothetical protein